MSRHAWSYWANCFERDATFMVFLLSFAFVSVPVYSALYSWLPICQICHFLLLISFFHGWGNPSAPVVFIKIDTRSASRRNSLCEKIKPKKLSLIEYLFFEKSLRDIAVKEVSILQHNNVFIGEILKMQN